MADKGYILNFVLVFFKILCVDLLLLLGFNLRLQKVNLDFQTVDCIEGIFVFL